MAHHNDSSSGLLLPNLLIIIMVSWGIISSSEPLNTSRPDRGLHANNHTHISARAWEDPLTALEHFLDKNDRAHTFFSSHNENDAPRVDGKPIASIQQTIAEWNQTMTPTLGLIITVPDGFSAKNTERRRRLRYSALAAISESASYIPEQGSQLHCSYYDTSETRWAIPYEIINATHTVWEWRSRKFNSVMILYVNEGYLEESAYHQLRTFVDKMTLAAESCTKHESSKPSPPPKFAIIGPTSSGQYDNIVSDATFHDIKRQIEPDEPPFKTAVTMYASMPTRSTNQTRSYVQRRIYDEFHNTPQIRQSFMAAIQRQGLATEKTNLWNGIRNYWSSLSKHRYDLNFADSFLIKRLSGDDFSICSALVAELKNRGIDPSSPESPVLLITEYDTLYGKSLPQSFRQAAWSETLGQDKRNQVDIKHEQQIRTITYLNGLDGQTNHNSHSGTTDKNTDLSEIPWGNSQYDYVRRLVSRIRDLETAQGKRFAAIGVLGSDVYDKLLLLRALRKPFTHAQFFTTDMDATLLSPKERKYTNNLIVASPYGLSLRNALQHTIPPFRDTYQTATYLATLEAIHYFSMVRHGERIKLPPDGEERRRVPLPAERNVVRVYELGRQAPRLLSWYQVDDVSGEGAPIASDPNDTGLVAFPGWEENSAEKELKAQHAIPFFIFMYAFFCILIISLGKRGIKNHPQIEISRLSGKTSYIWTRAALASLFGSFVLLTTLFYFIHSLSGNASEEPFALWAGISIWPSAVIMAMTSTLCVYCVWKSWFDIQSAQLRCESQFLSLFENPTPVDHKVEARPRFHQLQILFRSALVWFPFMISSGKSAKEDNLPTLWHRFLITGSQSQRLLRSFAFTLILAAFYMAMTTYWNSPINPARGSGSRICFEWVRISSWLCQLFLLCYVLDAHLLSLRILQHIKQWLRGYNSPYITSEKSTQPKLTSNHHPYAAEANNDPGVWESQLAQIATAQVRATCPTVYYPFIAIFLLITSRNAIFDHFDWPLSLTLVLAFAIVILVMISIMLQHKSSSILSIARYRVTLALLNDQCKEAPLQKASKILETSKERTSLGIINNPLFKAILLPLGGTGIFQLIEIIAPSIKG
ncbi:hypothetical protein HW115_07875 [Verrucomicrobiaceae bacterium N1E253]|uniref:Uncharacterized protein n=1 Tax=Oceaniferula marina TaxID=2748318 RepID=A0A851GK29_9BACT|nr:hypothetical protein [Oceaniferula marina]NWK55525.1 hypothetical protein [Oceaniferula marina]